MGAQTWSHDAATGDQDPMALDELDGTGVLVLDGVTEHDDERLGWCLRAPCVVVGRTPPGHVPSRAVDVSIDADDDGERLLDRIVERVNERPQASRALVDVLRTTADHTSTAALAVESLAYSMLLGGREFAEWRAANPPKPAKTFAAPPVRVDRHGNELRITLSRPENRNAFSAAMRDGLFEALALAEVDGTVGAIVLAGEGPTFSSGGDLTEFGTATDLVRAHEIRTLRSCGAAVSRLAAKTTVIVHGSCVGAGVELSAFAGRVVARPGTTFRLPEVAMGLIPGAGGTASLPRRIGRQRTALLAILDEPIDVDTALAWGLVDAIDAVDAVTEP